MSDLNNIDIKNRTRNKVVNIATVIRNGLSVSYDYDVVSPNSSLRRPLRTFSILFSCLRKSNKV